MILPILLEVFGSSSSSSSCMEAFAVVASSLTVLRFPLPGRVPVQGVRTVLKHCHKELWLIRNRDLPRGNVKCQRKWP